MEHASGVGADTQWFNTTKHQKHALVTGIVDIEKRLFALPFGATGSLYFKGDLPVQLRRELYMPGSTDEGGDSNIYCIGPICDYMFWYGQRSNLALDRGPWENPTQYLSAVATKEVKWIEQFGKPLECDFPHNTVFPGVNSHQDYLELLQKYLAIAPCLLPKDPSNPLNRPVLRHPDLTPGNVFICPDTHKVKCIIDWQHTVIKPLALAAGYPRLFENPDPEPPQGLEAPKYPEGYDNMDTETKAQIKELVRRQTLFYLYRVFNGGLNKPHLAALQDPLFSLRQYLVEFAGRQWGGNLMTLRGALIRTFESWDCLPGRENTQKCPIEFSEQEIQKQNDDEPMWCNLNALVQQWRDELGSSRSV
ncbi:predicted protein [Uncinocarpus reesii 1704]|uniref:Aminoglycoside phosphotransferase domain-containing protein n=1 Tax=Uncinocarpus reesii (strain UAMH 1704) TaxID=336963 RepID=C4JQC7_UNCRE|nr:uncharacterized protein UREG_04681 [Uncinocarpus reesii 1704]EEP79835.1 predicted protein [Uncinocarpus reesii 1704]